MTILENLDLLKDALHEAGLSALSVTIIKTQAETLLTEVDRLTAELNEYKKIGFTALGVQELQRVSRINAEDNIQLRAELQTVKAERDAAIKDLYEACTRSPCNNGICVTKNCTGNIIPCKFEWRGRSGENG